MALDTKQALVVAAKLRGQFEAFKYIEELLATVASTDNYIAEQQKVLDELAPAIAAAKEAKAKAEAAFKSKSAEIDLKLATKKSEVEAQMLQLDNEVRLQAEALDHAVEQMQAGLVAAREAHAAEMAKLTEQRTALDYEISALSHQLADLKAKIGAI